MDEICILDLCKSYKGKPAVDHLSLTLPSTGVFSLLGVNGAGKTTTIRMLSCLVAPDSGDALLLGHSVVREPHCVKEMIGVSPQETAVAPNLTVKENLQLMSALYFKEKQQQQLQIDTCLKRLSLEEVYNKKAKTLSGGWQRRLSIAMALIGKPRILFLDEPTLGLDVLARRELWEVIRSLKKDTTILLTTHYLEEAQALSDCIAILAHGRLKACGTAEELCRQTGCENFEDAFMACAKEDLPQ